MGFFYQDRRSTVLLVRSRLVRFPLLEHGTVSILIIAFNDEDGEVVATGVTLCPVHGLRHLALARLVLPTRHAQRRRQLVLERAPDIALEQPVCRDQGERVQKV